MTEYDLRAHEVEEPLVMYQIETTAPAPGMSVDERREIIEANQQRIDDLRKRIKNLAIDS